MTKPAGNNALAKYGAGQANIGCSSLSASVWGWTFSKKLFGNFIIIFLFSIATGLDQQQIPRTSSMQNVACKRIGHPTNFKVTNNKWKFD